ncbi:diguanylate cyclase [Marichromatium gracile]|uniref:diguanylate cyclase n=2 Tax=Marichromatium gracile TaxID=1048 RepID=A0A4R4A792_MARGR|nr:diguanylate cyclase [Marichromatium gracile]MBK1709118.1 diguanylate cyclase [Marichromatium gracile]TCW34697.1 response regulator receiver modulated diguanylate cyclase [Marichromatium gracile]
MSTSQTSRGERLRRMRERFLAELPERIDELERGWSHVLETAGRPAALEAFHRPVHSLAGTAGTFGQPGLGDQAREIEDVLERLDQSEEESVRLELLERIGARLKALRRYALQIPEALETAAAVEPARLEPIPAETRGEAPSCLLLIEEDRASAEDLVEQLGYYGWDVIWCESLARARAVLETQRIRAIVSDCSPLPEGGVSATPSSTSPNRTGTEPPLIMVSSHWNWDSRLAAVRSGADACLSKPIDVHSLADLLDKLTCTHASDPYRVLILDDSVPLGDYYVAVLRDAGMLAYAISEPSALLDSIATFEPELILLDLYMPDCNGIEAARVVRQEERHAGIPIVFLSGESDRQQQLSAMGTGADDFLTKPIPDVDLVRAVELRVSRFRSLTALIRQDSLTGLLNRIAFDLHLETEVARSSRSDAPLVLAILDIDHFKQVNDTYGHPVGDRVIRSLAQMLRKRLRRHDVIGRYGGEEFSVLMPDTTIAAAEKVMNALREQFALLRLPNASGHFQCTFSAGLAELDDHYSSIALTSTADAALYQAKRLGRNRVVCANGDKELAAPL